MKTIIEMAREAGWQEDLFGFGIWDSKELNVFAALVRADEREAWEHKYARLQSLMEIRETQPNKPCCLVEREECAKVCEPSEEHRREASWGYLGGEEGVKLLDAKAADIRARGNT